MLQVVRTAQPMARATEPSSATAAPAAPTSASNSSPQPSATAPSYTESAGSAKSAGSAESAQPRQQLVRDIMTSEGLHTMRPDATVDEALRVIVNCRVSGLPVIDADGIVVGVVSDFDLLNLDGVLEERVRPSLVAHVSCSLWIGREWLGQEWLGQERGGTCW